MMTKMMSNGTLNKPILKYDIRQPGTTEEQDNGNRDDVYANTLGSFKRNIADEVKMDKAENNMDVDNNKAFSRKLPCKILLTKVNLKINFLWSFIDW